MNTMEMAKQWIYRHTVCDDSGIMVNSRKQILYPEVTGYFIPSLLNAGETELAKKFALKMCAIQHEDGSWFDADNIAPFVFDGGQILKGLIAVRDLLPEVDKHILKGIDWILNQMNGEGRLVQPDTSVWGTDDSFCNDLIHIYAVSPILEAGRIFKRSDYIEKGNAVLDYYINNYRHRIVDFTLFSHFYAYVIEGLIDCGREELAEEAMNNFQQFQKANGAICAYNDVEWVCSTATFQFAIIWYKLGEKEKADLSFQYMCNLQNPSGGWYGCYTGSKLNEIKLRLGKKAGLTHRKLYAYNAEISWAVKFYLDAAYYKELSENK